MTDTIYNYPKSSCAPTEVPTNMSVRGCKFSPYYDCRNRRQFELQQEPQSQQGLIVINKGAVAHDKFASGYKKIDSKNPKI